MVFEACPTNSADKQPLQFTMNRVLFKIFGAMAKDSYLEISSHLGIHPLEQSIALRGDKFVKKVQFVGQLFMSADSRNISVSSCFLVFFLFSLCYIHKCTFLAYFDATIKLVK